MGRQGKPGPRHGGKPVCAFIPAAGALLLLQGGAEIVRCVLCHKRGEWPSRTEDVVEVDVDKLKQMVHVKDEQIEALDSLVIEQQRKEHDEEANR